MGLNISDIIKIIITSISIIDFLVFIVLFLSFMFHVPYKTKEISTKIVSIFITIFFITFKILHIPVFISTLPIDFKIAGSEIIIGVLTWTNIVLAAVPLSLAIFTAFIYRKSSKEILKKFETKKVNIIMPIYNESPKSLLKAIESILNLDYPKHLIHLYLAFDEDVSKNNSDAFKKLLEYYELPFDTRKNHRINIDLEGVLVSICRFKHGGKKSAQFGAFKEMEKDNRNLEEALVFFIDSDIVLKNDSLSQFTYFMEKNNKSALTGIISCIASKKPTFLTFYQDIEYISGQIFWRNLEVFFGSTTCLPGAFTILKYKFLKRVSDIYFNSNKYEDNCDYQRFYLGEDRYLTHLLMEIEPWQLGFCESARCKTDAPNTFMGLLKQRRRWYLGHIANDTWMISSLKLWKMYPLLCLFNLLNNTRNTSIYIYLLYFVLLLNKETPLMSWLLFILMPLMLNWFFICIYAFKIKRKMNIVFYITIIFLQPLFSMAYLYYTIWTIRQKSWGGVRVEQERKKEFETILNEITIH